MGLLFWLPDETPDFHSPPCPSCFLLARSRYYYNKNIRDAGVAEQISLRIPLQSADYGKTLLSCLAFCSSVDDEDETTLLEGRQKLSIQPLGVSARIAPHIDRHSTKVGQDWSLLTTPVQLTLFPSAFFVFSIRQPMNIWRVNHCFATSFFTRCLKIYLKQIICISGCLRLLPLANRLYGKEKRRRRRQNTVTSLVKWIYFTKEYVSQINPCQNIEVRAQEKVTTCKALMWTKASM